MSGAGPEREPRGVFNPRVVDLVSFDAERDEVVLLMLEERAWGSDPEQLRQLEKMYKANDLTEDTEKIILKRHRFWVEMAEQFLKRAYIERDFVLKVVLPRKEKSLKEDAVKQALVLDKAHKTALPQVEEKDQTLAKTRRDLDRLRHALEVLRKDRAAMTIAAPV